MLKMICLVSFIALAGCRTPIPIDEIFVIDKAHNICSRREITNNRTLSSKWVEDMPIEACDGYIAVTPETFSNLRSKLKRDNK